MDVNAFIEKFIYNYKLAMITQYLVSQGASNLQKSKTKSVKAVNCPQVNKEMTFHCQLLMESFCIIFEKYILLINGKSKNRLSQSIKLKYIQQYVTLP